MATKYQNGQVPASALVQLDTGNGYHMTSPYGRYVWYKLRALAKSRYGKTLHISPGYCAYRPLAAQKQAREDACNRGNCLAAAWPGTSSHGGTWEDRIYTKGVIVDAMAFDIGDWSQLSWTQFKGLCESVGLIVGAITADDEGATEPWHVVLLDPWRAVPKEDDDMTLKFPTTSFTAGQKIDGTMSYLLWGPKGYITLAEGTGPVDVLGGQLNINVAVTKAGKAANDSLLIKAVVDTVDANGKTLNDKQTSLGTAEFMMTSGNTGINMPIPPVRLAANRRLRIMAATSGGMELKVNGAYYRGVVAD